MKKIFKIVGLLLVLIIVLFFAMPMGHKSFDELYSGDQAIKQSLEEFRKYPTKTITVNGLKWYYLDIGSGEQTLLMLHGMGGSYDIWFQQIEALKSDVRIISVTYPAAQSLDELADGIIHILDTENVAKTNVIGTSLGGYLTQFLLKKYPNRLAKVIIANTFPPNGQFLAKNGKLAKVIPYVPEWLLMKTFRKNIKEKVVPAANNNPLVEAFLLEQDYGIMSKAQFIGRLKCVLQYFEPIATDSITNKMLIIESDNDPLIPSDLRDSLKLNFPNAAVKTFHNTGHFTYLNEPQKYTSVLSQFLFNNAIEDKKSITNMITNYYFEGRKKGDTTLLAMAFTKNAVLTTVTNSEEVKASVQDYLSMVAQKGPVTCQTQILNINVQGSIGMAKTRFNYGPVAYVDYLSLEKINNQWKIASKLYTKE